MDQLQASRSFYAARDLKDLVELKDEIIRAGSRGVSLRLAGPSTAARDRLVDIRAIQKAIYTAALEAVTDEIDNAHNELRKTLDK